MGVYVYRLRKKHKECDLLGIYPVRVMAFDFGYKLSYPYPSEPGYGRYQGMQNRIQAHAHNAAEHYLQLAVQEHGTSDIPFYFAFGGLVDGAVVYKTPDGRIPEVLSDDSEIHYENVGMLQKTSRRWVIDKNCLKHVWKNSSLVSDFRNNHAPMLPARVCNRCQKFEYLDRTLQAQYEATRS